jgi:lipopolysaccharide/colanic/teichoic acid biosynthesis glycosyltransferase
LQRLELLTRLWAHDAKRGIRRILDIVSSGLGLVLLSPLLVLTAIAIKVTSPGPILYRQERLGRQGRRFFMLKFRTMVQNADSQKSKLSGGNPGALSSVRFKMKRDPRITSVGRIMRKLSIDELPQLCNVLLGDMTLVGPRPPVWREVALYDARALRRLEVEQGLTCLWQVGGRSDLSFEQQVELDIDYIDRVTPFEELLILAKTIPAVVTGRGAY